MFSGQVQHYRSSVPKNWQIARGRVSLMQSGCRVFVRLYESIVGIVLPVCPILPKEFADGKVKGKNFAEKTLMHIPKATSLL